MTIINNNPDDCDDVAQLREWVLHLQEMVGILRQLEKCNKRMVDFSERVMDKQEQMITLLTRKSELLEERVTKYEVAFSAESVNHVRRLN